VQRRCRIDGPGRLRGSASSAGPTGRDESHPNLEERPMSPTNRRRSTAILLGCAVPLLAALAAAPQADAATIYACVKKTSGATRIVSRTARCKRGERRLSWSVAGPAGANGANGAAGANGPGGANGAVAGFLARNAGPTPLSGKGLQVLVSKVLPPGSFVFNVKVFLTAHAAAKSTALVECLILDAPGTTAPTTGEPLDAGAWGAVLEAGIPSEFNAYATLPFAAGFSSSVTTTLDLACAGSASITASFAQLTAIQTSQLG
jgi:hypothetical protein